MNDALLKLYERWRELGAAETAGIHAGDWRKIERAQAAKQALQPQIDEQIRAFRQEVERASGDWRKAGSALKTILDELTQLELRNRDLLQAKMQEVRFVRDDLQRASRNLRQVQRAYATESDAIWHSYS